MHVAVRTQEVLIQNKLKLNCVASPIFSLISLLVVLYGSTSMLVGESLFGTKNTFDLRTPFDNLYDRTVLMYKLVICPTLPENIGLVRF
jgi:hypothetical protein